MYSDELAIKVAGLSKSYNIYNKPADRLKQAVVPRVFPLLGKPVPVYYREFWALRDVSLEVKKGETVGIIGRNGSGKSTLLQMICKTLTPTSGTIETKGRITALLELGSGFNPEFTGRENVFLNGAILGLSKEEVEDRFDAIAAFADIGDFIEQPVKFYSSGMTVRLAFAVQAMVDPDILVVDEALAVGDEMFQRKCFRRINELKSIGTSILLVSHSGQQIIELCDRALLLEQGQRLLFADPLTVVRAYQKMIFANPDEQARLAQEFKALGDGNVTRVDPVPDDHGEEDMPPHVETKDLIPKTDFFENGMIPQTTEFQPVRGARIDSVKIYNQAGRKVNNLLAGNEYDFVIDGVSLRDFNAINIRVLIHSKRGNPVTGVFHPGSNKHISIMSGQKFCFTVRMKMNLMPDTYFVTVSVWADSEQTPLHRVVDMIMFGILPKTNNQAFGYVDLTIGEPEFKIIEE